MLEARTMPWRGEITLGRVRFAALADAPLPGVGEELAVRACEPLQRRPMPAPHAVRWLRPVAESARAHALIARALEEAGLAALAAPPGGGREACLWGMAGGLALGGADDPAASAVEPTVEELALASQLLETLVRRAAAPPEPAGGCEIVRFEDLRRRRLRRA
jgi:hypothetical protein